MHCPVCPVTPGPDQLYENPAGAHKVFVVAVPQKELFV